MKRPIAALLSTLTLVACETSDRPARDPSTAAPRTSLESQPSSQSNSVPATNPAGATDTMGTNAGATGGRHDEVTASANASDAKPDAGVTGPTATGELGRTTGVTTGAAPSDRGTSDATKSDSTDRRGGLTASNQGGAEAERKITAAVRRAVMSDKALSFKAKNVKIITNGNKVTLRGGVKTDEEKAAVEADARQTPGVTEVDNQIEVGK